MSKYGTPGYLPKREREKKGFDLDPMPTRKPTLFKVTLVYAVEAADVTVAMAKVAGSLIDRADMTLAEMLVVEWGGT